MAKKFFYVCGGLLMLTLAYQFGASTAKAQSGGTVAGIAAQTGAVWAITTNGDVYLRGNGNAWQFEANVFTSSPPVPTTDATWGQVKARYR